MFVPLWLFYCSILLFPLLLLLLLLLLQVCSGVADSCFVPWEDGDLVLGRMQEANTTLTIPTIPLLVGFNSNEGFLQLMQFLTK